MQKEKIKEREREKIDQSIHISEIPSKNIIPNW